MFCLLYLTFAQIINVLGLRSHLCNIAILHVVAKNLPISSRLSPRIFYRNAELVLLHLDKKWLDFFAALRFHALRSGNQNKRNHAVKIRSHKICPINTYITIIFNSELRGYTLLHPSDELMPVRLPRPSLLRDFYPPLLGG